MIYGDSVWGGGNLSNVCKIERINKSAINTFICNLQPNVTPPLKFKYVYKLNCSTQFHKYKFNATFEYFFIKILKLIASHDHNTRFLVNHNYSFSVISKTIYQKQFVINEIKLWNNLPPELKLEQLTTTFKRKLKTLLYSTL